MRRILVTGANKGIGLAIVEAILARADDTFVHLGSRDAGRGREAVASIVARNAAFVGRVEAFELDVTTDASVIAAGARLAETHEKLFGLVNNAALGAAGGTLARILETNFFGARRVTEVFLPFVDPNGGRVVMVSSASGPMFVAGCEPARQRELVDDQITGERLQAIADEYLAAGKLEASGAYGLSKALLNGYTMLLAREHPRLRINACTPGFIATDLTKPFLSGGQTPEQAGMKTPADGAKTPLSLLFDDLPGNGRYYGSDGKRSPLDRYRAPGSAEYAP